MRFVLGLLVLSFLFAACANAQTQIEDFVVSPLCDMNGLVTCPLGLKPDCANEEGSSTEPKCIFYGDKFISGCLKFVGMKKIDLNFEALMISPGSMIKVIGGGETYTLNREIVGCKKL